MFYTVEGLSDTGLNCVKRLPEFFWKGGWADGICLRTEALPQGEGNDDLTVELCGTECHIVYRQPVQLFRGLGLLREHAFTGRYSVREQMCFDETGVMMDVSRNSVPGIPMLKQILDRMALMGLNRLILYMEDVYELEGEPRFGYMRGAYTQKELRMLDDYADGYGIRIVASIQVLGHLEKILRFPEYKNLRDSASCLLVGEEKTYQLIDKMIRTISECLRSRTVYIGMDETHGLGEGRYRSLNGPCNPIDIFMEHVGRVNLILSQYGMEGFMYSDMIFKYASDRHTYLDPDVHLEKIKEQLPSNINLIYWDYYSTAPALFDAMMECHCKTGNAAYAGPMLSVSSFCVQYEATFRVAGTALAAARRHGIRTVYGCLWHDDGAECSDWLGLLGMQYYAEQAYSSGAVNPGTLDSRIQACCGLRAEWFLDAGLLDAVSGINTDNRWPPNLCKYLLWQDPLEGVFDADLRGLKLSEHYGMVESRLRKDMEEAGEAGWFLRVPHGLARVLEVKTMLAEKLTLHYMEHNMEALRKDADMASELSELVKNLRLLHLEQWMATCTPFGWSRLDLRYGGLLSRLDTTVLRLTQYLNREIESLPELEVPRFPNDRVGDRLGNGIWKVYADIATLSE